MLTWSIFAGLVTYINAIYSCYDGAVYSDFIMQVVKCLPVLSQLLYHDNQNVISDACWSLSFLADGSNKRIQLVIDAGVTLRLIELLL